jgi:hypothetical protein
VTTEVAGELRFNYPAGIALVQDESALLVSGLDRSMGTSTVFRIELATGEIATFNKGIENNTDSAGLRRARNADIYAWANSAGEMRSDRFSDGGTVYILKGRSAIGEIAK